MAKTKSETPNHRCYLVKTWKTKLKTVVTHAERCFRVVQISYPSKLSIYDVRSELRVNARASGKAARGGAKGHKYLSFPPLALVFFRVTSRDSPNWELRRLKSSLCEDRLVGFIKISCPFN